MGSAAFYRQVRQGQIAHDQGMGDAFRQRELEQYTTVGNNIQQILANGRLTDPQTRQIRPITEEERASLSQAKSQVDAYLKNLYNPNFDPMKGSVSRDPILRLTDKLGITHAPQQQPAVVPPTGQDEPQRSAAQQMSDLRNIQAKYGMMPENNKLLQFKQELTEAGFTPDQVRKAMEIQAGIQAKPIAQRQFWEVLYGTVDGKPVTWQRNRLDNSVVDMAGEEVPDDLLNKFVLTPKPGSQKPRQAWGKDDKGYFSVLLDPQTNAPIAGSQNYGVIPPTSLVGRITTGYFHFADENGNVHQIAETKTSLPNRPISTPSGGASAPAGAASGGASAAGSSAAAGSGTGGKGAGSEKKTPGQQKKDLKNITAKGAGSGASGDKVIGNKGSKDLVDTKAAYQAAIDRQKIMHQNLENALNGDQQAMLSLTANHIGMTLGAQKGARINQAVWDEAVASAPWLEKVGARWDSRGYLSGVVLTPEQMQQMVSLADEKVQNLKDHVDRLEAERGRAVAPAGDSDIDDIVRALNKTPAPKKGK